jgi:hypothetical protein
VTEDLRITEFDFGDLQRRVTYLSDLPSFLRSRRKVSRSSFERADDGVFHRGRVLLKRTGGYSHVHILMRTAEGAKHDLAVQGDRKALERRLGSWRYSRLPR